jgi:hypothetical protein
LLKKIDKEGQNIKVVLFPLRKEKLMLISIHQVVLILILKMKITKKIRWIIMEKNLGRIIAYNNKTINLIIKIL